MTYNIEESGISGGRFRSLCAGQAISAACGQKRERRRLEGTFQRTDASGCSFEGALFDGASAKRQAAHSEESAHGKNFKKMSASHFHLICVLYHKAIPNKEATSMKTTLKSTLKALLTLTFILTLLLNGTAFAQSAFDQTAAENLALEAAGATRERALLFPTEIETEHGQTAYDVEFRCDGFEYEYWISTTDGAIIKRAWALTSQKTLEMAAYQDAAAIVIGEQQALDKALADAGLTEADITLLEISLDTDDMLRLYEIEFYTATAEYDYDVDAVSGTVCGASIEYFAENETVRPGQQPASPETVASAQGISREKARSIALSDASLSAADVTFTKTKLDREDGMLVYEIEFVTAAAEYEYEIDAVTDAIRERSIETRATAQPAASSYIGVDQAKSIALKHAGLSAAEVSFTKAKLEKDDGLRKYEIEFIKGSTEYEYEIDAATGSVLEYDVERSEPAPSNDDRQPDRDDDHDDHHDDDRDDDHDDDDDDDDD